MEAKLYEDSYFVEQSTQEKSAQGVPELYRKNPMSLWLNSELRIYMQKLPRPGKEPLKRIKHGKKSSGLPRTRNRSHLTNQSGKTVS